MIDYYAPNLDLTLLGCGFLGSYHLGAIYLLKQIWPQRPYNRICGASCGGLLAALLLSGLKLELVLYHAAGIIRHLRAVLRNPMKVASLASISELVESVCEKLLPSNAHELCTNKLGLSLTKLGRPLENKFLSCFESRRQLIDAICAGCFIPIWSGALLGPQIGGKHFIDGAYTNNNPRFHDSRAASAVQTFNIRTQAQPIWVDLSPLASEVEVSPRNERYLFRARVMSTLYKANWRNLVRSWQAMFPSQLSSYKSFLVGGHADMKEFLFRAKLIKCRQCYESPCDKTTQFGCIRCLRLLERVDSLRVSDQLIHLLDD